MWALTGISLLVKAQSGYNYAPWGIQVGASSVRAYDDLKKTYDRWAFEGSFVYNYSPYLPVAAELQFGALSGGSNTNRALDVSGRQYSNHYKSLLLHADIQVGEILNYGDNFFLNVLKNCYIGTGLALMSNTMTFVQRDDPYNKGYVFPGKDNSLAFVVPLRAGYEIKFFNEFDEPVWCLDLGYRHNISFGEGMDGYDDPNNKFKNNALDQYRQITVGIKYNFGNRIAYNKNIRRAF